MKTKQPWLAFVLSLLVCGFGQFYNGHLLKGGVQLLIPMVLLVEGVAFPTGVLAQVLPEKLKGVLLIVNWGWSIIDATLSAHKIKEEKGLL